MSAELTGLKRALKVAPVAQWQWHKSLAAVRLVYVAARLRRSGFKPRLWWLFGTCRSTKRIFRDYYLGQAQCPVKSVTGH